MSVTHTLSNALSGLTAAARQAQAVSSNVANALTDGYGAREVVLSSRSLGGTGAGVKIDGIVRHVDQQLVDDRRLAEAARGLADPGARFLTALEAAMGTPEDPASLTGRIDRFEAALIEAASRPDSPPRLDAAVAAAHQVTAEFARLSDNIQAARMDAEAEISGMVDKINADLARIADLNGQISRLSGAGRDTSALKDQRQQLVDGIAEFVPVHEVSRQRDQIALFTTGGAILLDGAPASLGFERANYITADMTHASSALSGLTINGQDVAISGPGSPIRGGRLAAVFEVRDGLATDAQAKLDALAAELVGRYQGLAADPTIGAGDAGLFTDAGLAFTATDSIGLASRLAINPAVDPNAGGAAWRLRDGIQASAPGPVGDARLLGALADALAAPASPSDPVLGIASRSFPGVVADVMSSISASAQRAESDRLHASSRYDSLKTAELAAGVDTDAELQRLLLVEQAYAANAKVIQTVDELIDRLMAI